ncbi:MAG TPA: phosphatase PAP2 family protein [Chthoniobacterales bacterium]|jgi:undecaprenyl-diphosphatase
MDQTIFHLINERWTHPALDLFMAAISDVEIWKPFLIVLGLCAVIFLGFKGRAFVVCLVLALVLADYFLVSTLKTAIDRRRPKQVQNVRMVQLERSSPQFLTLFKQPTIRYSDESDRGKSGPSFPSGHVTDNVIIGTICALFFRRWGWLYFIMAAAVGYSRIYLGAHWPSDVLGSAFMAAGEALLVVALAEWIWKRWGPRWAPRLAARHPRLIE